MGANDHEIFSLLRKVGEGVVRIDERTERIDRDMREHHADHEARLRNLELSTAKQTDHETRIRTLENESNKRKGIVAAIVIGVSAVFQGLAWCVKHFFGGAT